MNNRLFIRQAIISILLYLMISNPISSQENVNGYWKFSHIKVTDKDEIRKGSYFGGMQNKGFYDDDETTAYFSDCLGGMTYNYSWAVPSRFDGKFIYTADLTWGEIPKILIPGKEYSISVNAQMTKCIRPSTPMSRPYGGQMGVKLIICQSAESSVDVESNIRTQENVGYYAADTIIAVYSKEESVSEKIVKPIVNNSDKALYRFTPPAAGTPGIGWETINGEIQEIFSKIEDQKYAIMVVGKSVGYLEDCYKHLLYVYKWETGKPEENIANEPEKKEESELFLKITPSPRDIKADGKSTSEITAYLYEFTPGTDTPRKPLTGKTLTFDIEELDGVKPGTLSKTTAVTDENGKATFTYTAPTFELMQKRRAMWQNVSTIKIRCNEYDIEDLAYIGFITDKGKIWVNSGTGILPRKGFVPPDKRYPALITATFEDDNLEPIKNTEVTFSINESNPVGMLRSTDGHEGKQITVKTDASGAAYVQYFYAASTPPKKQITETIEAKTKNMSYPLKAYVSTAFNIVLENAETVSDSKEFNSDERVPLKITVKDEWNPDINLGEVLNLWGVGEEGGENKLYVKLKIEKLSYVPNSMLDLMGEKSYPEPLYEELLRPQSLNGAKNILLLPDYSIRAGFPVVRPGFSGVTNYVVSVSLVDEKGETVFESSHPRATTLISVPSGYADAGRIWFASNPLGPHTPEARFIRMLLSTVSFGDEKVGFGVVISLADAAFAINKGDTEALVNIMLGEIKNKVLSDLSEKTGVPAERIGKYNNMAIAEQYLSFAITTESDQGLIAQMESKILTGIASAGFGEENQMVVLKGNGSQKLLIEAGQKPKSKLGKSIRDNFKISFSGMDKETKDLVDKVGKKLKGKGKEVPCIEGKFNYDDELNIISLKNGNVSIYTIPADMKVTSENATEMKIY